MSKGVHLWDFGLRIQDLGTKKLTTVGSRAWLDPNSKKHDSPKPLKRVKVTTLFYMRLGPPI